MKVKNTPMQKLGVNTFSRGSDRNGNFVPVLTESFLELTIACHDKFLIEIVTVDVDGSFLVNVATHENDTIL
jgi:hypothetical protein